MKLQGKIGTALESLGCTISITMEITELEVKTRKGKEKEIQERVRLPRENGIILNIKFWNIKI